LGKPWGDDKQGKEFGDAYSPMQWKTENAAGRETERRVGADVTLAQSWTTTQSLTSASGVTGADHHLQHRTYAYRADGYLTLAERTAPDGHVSTWDYAPDSHRPVGTPTELVSATGDLAWQRRTPPLWGTGFPSPQDDEATVDCPLRFPGQDQLQGDATSIEATLNEFRLWEYIDIPEDGESEAGGLALAEEIAASWRRCLSETFPDRAFAVAASATEDGPVVGFVTIR
jgi:hypothetical protein